MKVLEIVSCQRSGISNSFCHFCQSIPWSPHLNAYENERLYHWLLTGPNQNGPILRALSLKNVNFHTKFAEKDRNVITFDELYATRLLNGQ